MVDEIRNKLGRKLFQRTSQKQVQYHKESKLWIPHRKRVYLYWFKFLQIAEQDPKRKVNWKKYEGWGGANYILGVKNFDEFWNDNWTKLFGLKTLKDKQRFPISTSKPKIESIRTSYLVHQKLHLQSYVKIAQEIQESELTNRKGVKDFKDATNEVITEFGIYNTKNHKIIKKEKDEVRKIKLSANLIKEKFGNVSKDNKKLKKYKNSLINRKINAESKKIVIGAVNHYRITAESILDGVCEGKYPETPDMRKKETFVRGEGKKKPTKKKSVNEKVENEIAAIIETYENAEDDAIKAMEQKICDFIMPDLMRICGISGWMQTASIAAAYRIKMSTHLFPEVSSQLMRVTPTAHLCEWTDWTEAILEEPYKLKDGNIIIPDVPGTGIDFREDILDKYKINL